MISNENAIFYQIGDGAIVYATVDEPEEYCLFQWPQQGEYANTTNFVTDSTASDNLICETVAARVDDVAVFTDGLQRVALDYRGRIAYAPFFEGMFKPLRTNNELQLLESELAIFLESPKINDRTSDDKTLILASRRQLAPEKN